MTTELLPEIRIVNGMPRVSSRAVAERFKKRHDDVLKAIRNLISQKSDLGLRNFAETPYVDPQNGQTYKSYELDRKGFTLLAMGFTGADALEWKLQYIDAFDAMEGELRRGGVDLAAEIAALRADVRGLIEQAQRAEPGRALVTTHASANEIAIERGAKQKGRHGLTVRIGNFLELACRDAGEQVLPGRDGKRMFPRSIMMGHVLDYVDALVADHNRALDAQGDLLGTGRRRALAKVAQSEDARLPFLSEMLGSDFDGFLRLHQVDENTMEPTVRKHGDWLLVRNLREFDGDGLYLIEMGRAGHEYESCFRCDAHPDGYRLIRDNGAYGPPGVLSVEDFRRRVRAKVVFAFTKQDYRWPKAA